MADSSPAPALPAPVPSMMTPQEIVSELDKFIVGQGEAKRAVAIAGDLCIYTNQQHVIETL